MAKNKLVLLLALVVMVAMLTSSVLAQEEGEVVVDEGDDVMVGLATILSGEGLVPFGDDITRGVELALEDRPSVIVDDVEFAIALDLQDDQCSAEGGQAIANRFVSDPSIVAVVGPTCSSACAAAAPIFDDAGYTTISTSCTAVNLTSEEEGFTSFNRTAANDNIQGVAAADFIYNELGVESIATIHDGSAYGEGIVEILTRAFEELGGGVVFADSLTVGDTDFRSLLESAAAAEPGLLYFGGFNAEGARLAEQRADVGLEEVPLFGPEGIYGAEFVNLGGEAAEGVYASRPLAPATEEVDEFLARYVENYGLEPTAPFQVYAYDAINMIMDAIEEVGTINDDGALVVSRADLSEYIRSYGAEEPVEGLSGEISCDGTGDCGSAEIGIFQVVDGEYVEVEMGE